MVSVTVAIIFYILLDILLHLYLFGFNISMIKATIFGDEKNFIEPILFESLLLQVHIDFFMTFFAVMILSSIYIRYYRFKKYSRFLLHLLLFFSLLSPILLVVSFFSSSSFILYFWIIIFILWHIVALIISFFNLKSFGSNEK
jgi:hypothetical protein